jgi:hypothetical protein
MIFVEPGLLKIKTSYTTKFCLLNMLSQKGGVFVTEVNSLIIEIIFGYLVWNTKKISTFYTKFIK